MPLSNDAPPSDFLRRKARRAWWVLGMATLTAAILIAGNVLNYHDWAAAWIGTSSRIRACGGGIEITWDPGSASAGYLRGLHHGRMHVPLDWTPSATKLLREWRIFVPFWLPTSLALLCALIAARVIIKRRLRYREGLCHACGYDLSGLSTDAICPECAAIPKPADSTGQ